MGLTKEELIAKYNLGDHLYLLKKMQQPVHYEILQEVVHQPDSLLLGLAKKYPVLAPVLLNIGELINAVINVGKRLSLLDPAPENTTGKMFDNAGLAMAIYSVVRYPMLYLYKKITHQKIENPIEADAKKKKWYLSLFLLGLTVLSIIVPATGLYIASFMIGTGFLISVAMLCAVLVAARNVIKEQKKIKSEIEKQELEMDLIQEEIRHLERLLTAANEENLIIELLRDIALVQDSYEAKVREMQALKNKEAKLNQKFASLGLMQTIDRCVGVSMSTLTVVGFLIMFINPPLGAILLNIAVILSTAYLVGRVTAPLFMVFGKWVKNLMSKPETKDQESDLDLKEMKQKDTKPGSEDTNQLSQASSLVDWKKESDTNSKPRASNYVLSFFTPLKPNSANTENESDTLQLTSKAYKI